MFLWNIKKFKEGEKFFWKSRPMRKEEKYWKKPFPAPVGVGKIECIQTSSYPSSMPLQIRWILSSSRIQFKIIWIHMHSNKEHKNRTDLNLTVYFKSYYFSRYGWKLARFGMNTAWLFLQAQAHFFEFQPSFFKIIEKPMFNYILVSHFLKIKLWQHGKIIIRWK